MYILVIFDDQFFVIKDCSEYLKDFEDNDISLIDINNPQKPLFYKGKNIWEEIPSA